VGRLGEHLEDRCGLVRVDSGDEQVGLALGDRLGDRLELLLGLAGPVDHLGRAAAEGAEVVDLGEAQVGEGELLQPAQGAVDVDLAGADGLEQGAEGLGRHGAQAT
jgi:hypothetical protein